MTTEPRPQRGGRHPARRLALQTLFEIDFNRADARSTWERGRFRAGLTDEAADFAWQLVDGVLAHRRELDEEIGTLAPEFPLEQMNRIDRNILRIALFELRVAGDAPAGVVIDEAVELANAFGSEASARFVNGVLATAVGSGRKGSDRPSGG
ncbi:MAG TPA: transcription antitermination factor NusB [Candidatus Limnocylindria bacterium]|nr:transcription antitermination factor NusB [Candidatus Limnocylindria bacterium]